MDDYAANLVTPPPCMLPEAERNLPGWLIRGTAGRAGTSAWPRASRAGMGSASRRLEIPSDPGQGDSRATSEVPGNAAAGTLALTHRDLDGAPAPIPVVASPAASVEERSAAISTQPREVTSKDRPATTVPRREGDPVTPPPTPTVTCAKGAVPPDAPIEKMEVLLKEEAKIEPMLTRAGEPVETSLGGRRVLRFVRPMSHPAGAVPAVEAHDEVIVLDDSEDENT